MLICLCLASGAAAGCGSEEDAIRATTSSIAEAAKERDAAEVCRLVFSSSFLPPAVADRAGVPEGSPGRPADFEASQDECAKDLDEELKAFEKEPDLSDVEVRELRETQGIDAVASAAASFGDDEPMEVHFVRYEGEWRLLFISN